MGGERVEAMRNRGNQKRRGDGGFLLFIIFLIRFFIGGFGSDLHSNGFIK
jgi:hypothetical protein